MQAVLIPAFRPTDALLDIATALLEAGCEVIVINDGSGDEYKSIFDALPDRTVLLSHEKNLGKGVAIKTGLSYVKENLPECGQVGFMDADGQHLVADVIKALELAAKSPDAIVLGSREVGRNMPIKSRIGNEITNALFRICIRKRLADTQTGLRAFDANYIDTALSAEGTRYEYEMIALMTFASSNVPIIEMPINTIYHNGKNSNTSFRPIKDSAIIYGSMIKFGFRRIFSR